MPSCFHHWLAWIGAFLSLSLFHGITEEMILFNQLGSVTLCLEFGGVPNDYYERSIPKVGWV